MFVDRVGREHDLDARCAHELHEHEEAATSGGSVDAKHRGEVEQEELRRSHNDRLLLLMGVGTTQQIILLLLLP